MTHMHVAWLCLTRKSRDDGPKTVAAGAYVAYPKKGMHDWIGAIDTHQLISQCYL